jgi:hypothetical protein
MRHSRRKYLVFFGLFACLCLLSAINISAQPKTLAIIVIDENDLARGLEGTLRDSLAASFRFSDPELVEPVIHSSPEKNLLNLSLGSARDIGVGIGCDFYLILKAENLRRSSSKKNNYYEAYLAAFLVDARTGKLLAWKHLSAEADEPGAANKALTASFMEFIPAIPEISTSGLAAEQKEVFDTTVYEINDDSGKTLRTPLPFQRFSPATTPLAQYLRVEAVVDIEVAIDARGYITQTRIVRWAGFGLDEAVNETVRKMNFRSAILDGKAIPARFLLRYNFRVPVEPKK